jgi:hypothetical protein
MNPHPSLLPGKLVEFGSVMQLGYVPTDFDAAIGFWTEKLGVGPFFLWEHIAVDLITYRGAPTRVDFSAALSYWGDMEIELIRQHDQGASAYRDWNSNALHHIQLAVVDIDTAVAACEHEGFTVAMEGRGLLGSRDSRFVYCDLGANAPAAFVELVRRQPPGAAAAEMRARIKEQVRTWDGKVPVRPLF